MLTPEEAEILACHHRKVADCMDRLARVQRWKDQYQKAGTKDLEVQVNWLYGRSLEGYELLAPAVSRLIAPQIPKLIDDVVRGFEADVRVAQSHLPSGK